MGPDGVLVDPATTAENLREGGLYSVTRPALRDDKARRARDAAHTVATLPWALTAFGLAATLVALAASDSTIRWVAAGIVALAAVITSLAWAVQTRADTNFLSLAAPMTLGALAGALLVPPGTANYALFATAMAAAAVAALASLIAVATRLPRVRAGAATVSVIAVLVTALGLASPALRWDVGQLTIVLAAASVLGLRALPSLLVNVDEGYHIDYGEFMVLRWTVRGRVPEYIPQVESERVRQIVRNAEARLRVSTLLLSLFVAIGIPAAFVPLAEGNLLERIAATVFLTFAVLGVMLTSRRTVAPELRNPPRVAVLIGLTLGSLAVGLGGLGALTAIAAAGLIVVAAIAAVLSVSLARGTRSLGWSRTGDIVDSIAIALVLPAGVLAAGTLDLLRGVLAG